MGCLFWLYSWLELVIVEILGSSFDSNVVLRSHYMQGMVATIMHDVCLIKCLKNLYCTLFWITFCKPIFLFRTSSSIKGAMWFCLCWLKNSDLLEIVSDFISFINWLVPNYFSETLPQQYISKKFVVYSSLYLFALIENF